MDKIATKKDRNDNTIILLKYSKGKRNFRKQNFAGINLSGLSLIDIDLSETDLSCANLENCDLKGANLSKSCLKGSNLKGCNLSGAILNEADLSYGNLNHVNLTKARCKKTNFYRSHISSANLQNSYFSEANLVATSLNKSDLSYGNFQKANLNHGFLTGSNLTRTNFQEANLTNACLIRAIIDKTLFQGAEYNLQTLFDHHFLPEKHGMSEGGYISVAEIVNSLNYLSKTGSHYLGKSIIVKYLEKSRPHCEWVNSFKITNKGSIHYQGALTEIISDFELKWYQEWVKNYIQNCSIMVKGFIDLLEQDKIFLQQDKIVSPQYLNYNLEQKIS